MQSYDISKKTNPCSPSTLTRSNRVIHSQVPFRPSLGCRGPPPPFPGSSHRPTTQLLGLPSFWRTRRAAQLVGNPRGYVLSTLKHGVHDIITIFYFPFPHPFDFIKHPVPPPPAGESVRRNPCALPNPVCFCGKDSDENVIAFHLYRACGGVWRFRKRGVWFTCEG